MGRDTANLILGGDNEEMLAPLEPKDKNTAVIAPWATSKVPTTIAPPVQQSVQADTGAPKIRTYSDFEAALKKHDKETEDEVAKMEKKQRRNQIIAAIGDGMTALSNLFFTTRGAQNAYDGRNTLSQGMRARYDKMVDDYRKRRGAEAARKVEGMKYDNQLAIENRNYQYQLAKDAEAQKRYDALEAERKERQKIADQRYEAEQAAKAKAAQQTQENWNTQFNAEQDQNKVRNSQEWARIAKMNSGGSAKDKKELPTLRIGGKTLTFKTIEDWKKEIYKRAAEFGIPTTYEEVKEPGIGMNQYGRKVELHTKDLFQLAGEVERYDEVNNTPMHRDAGKRPNPMGESGNKNTSGKIKVW